jgi:L-seryl-tRNA(Ser) seleniumtransferase
MKVAKEQIVGMVAAVDWLLAQTNEAMQAEFIGRTDVIRRAVEGIPSVTTRIVTPEVANHVPHLLIDIDPQRLGVTPLQVADKLRAGKPSIELNPATGSDGRGFMGSVNSIILSTWMMQPGEEHIVARRLHETLTQAKA